MAGIAFTSPSLLFLRHKIRKILKHCVERGERGWWLYGGLVPGLQQQYRALIGAAAPGGLCARPQWGGRGRHLACVWGGEKGLDTRSPSPPPLPFSRDIKLSISLLTSSHDTSRVCSQRFPVSSSWKCGGGWYNGRLEICYHHVKLIFRLLTSLDLDRSKLKVIYILIYLYCLFI